MTKNTGVNLFGGVCYCGNTEKQVVATAYFNLTGPSLVTPTAKIICMWIDDRQRRVSFTTLSHRSIDGRKTGLQRVAFSLRFPYKSQKNMTGSF